jgi:hypothetical protein
MVLTLGDGQSGMRPSVAPGGGRHPAARIWNSLHLDTAVALPVGVQVSPHAPRGGRRPAMQYLPVPADSPVGPGPGSGFLTVLVGSAESAARMGQRASSRPCLRSIDDIEHGVPLPRLRHCPLKLCGRARGAVHADDDAAAIRRLVRRTLTKTPGSPLLRCCTARRTQSPAAFGPLGNDAHILSLSSPCLPPPG